MEAEPSADQPPPLPDHITPAERIHELTAIDKDITRILHSANLAFRSLHPSHIPTNTTITSSTTTSSQTDPTIEAQRAAFETHTTAFYTHVQSVAARLRRQAYALEEAGITAAEPAAAEPAPPPPPPRGQPAPGQAAGRPQGATTAMAMGAQARPEPPMVVTNGGLGGLDVGWLNSRRDEVGRQKEAELWAEARGVLEGVLEERKAGSASADVGVESDDEGESMDVDDEDSDGDKT